MNARLFLSLSFVVGAVFTVCLVGAHAAVPKEQRAIVQHSGSEALELQTVPVPTPGANQVLIRIYAAAVNPADWKSGAPPEDRIPGGDVAGVIEAVGKGVTGFHAGDPVFAIVVRRSGLFNGAYAEYAVASVANVMLKPANMTYAQAAGLGIATVTGVRAVDVMENAKGQRMLITGVAGGVGSAAAQAAKARGAYVIGTASPRHNAYLRSIGVDEVIDYTKVDFETQVGRVDAVLDTVGGQTALRSMRTLSKGGRYLSTGTHGLEAQCTAAGLICPPYRSAADVVRRVYEQVASLAGAGKLDVHIDKAFPLAQASEAQAYSKAGHAEGKIVLLVDTARAEQK